MEQTTGKKICGFLRERAGVIVGFCAVLAVFFTVMALYNVPLEVFRYAALLCTAGLAGAGAADLAGYLHRSRQRDRLRHCLPDLPEPLPKAEGQAERDYQTMLVQQSRLHREERQQWAQLRQESLDYYTTWVHQIKTPIAVMQMQLQAEDTEEHRELGAQLFRIEQYVELVLTYIRLGGQSDFVFRTCSVDRIVRRAVRKYAGQFVRRRIRLEYTPAEFAVLTDEKWLLFILEQLLSNAVKYTPRGSVTITADPERETLTVADTGIGIAPEDIPRIFEKGFTGHNGRVEQKSTGLGLYLCRRTAERLGIGISVTSQPGIGSAFTLELHTDSLQVE